MCHNCDDHPQFRGLFLYPDNRLILELDESVSLVCNMDTACAINSTIVDCF